MGYVQERTNRNLSKKTARSAYDRRAGNDRRSCSCQGYDEIEKRSTPERRVIIKEKRLGWVRDTKWSSINLELLR
ncbi:MAG: hypothetical protein ABIK15_17600 [Pseudomonadota bacterium]